MLPRSLSNALFTLARARPSPYDLLPTSTSSPPSYPKRSLLLLRRLRPRTKTLLLLLGLLATASIAAATFVLRYPLPPLYSRFHRAELALPQHNASLPAPEGGGGRYLWIANHASKCGWGNAMQELFLNAYLAYKSDRAFVFDNYTWSHGESDYSLYNLKPIPSRIPLTALIRGPIVGGNFPPGSQVPRAVVPEYFYEVCQDRQIISSREVKDSLSPDPSAGALIRAWTSKIAPHRCVEVERGPPEIFDEHLLGDAGRLLDIWPEFSQSPIVQAFSWSTLVELAFDNNREAISPDPDPLALPLSAQAMTGLARYTPIPGLLVLHIRRGDFEGHCRDVLARRSLGYTGYNSFPALPDRWHPLPEGISEREKHALYTLHCFPDIGAIVHRVEEVRRASSGLSRVYIMTNGARSWVAKLEAALLARYQWEHIGSSKDLMLNPEQKYVAQAVDMLIAQRAQTFVGNGFSTLSGMVIMLRMANGVDPNSNRHW